MLFEVPGLNLGEPKVEAVVQKQQVHKKEKPKVQSVVHHKQQVHKKEMNASNIPTKKDPQPPKNYASLPAKVQKPPSAKTSKSESAPTTLSPSLSIFKSDQKTKLQRKMEEKLMGSRFRYLNQKLYESDSKEALQYFKQNPDDFKNVRPKVVECSFSPRSII
jgi:ribosomal RNA-processing protein 8